MFWRPDISPGEAPFKVLLERGEFVDTGRNDRAVPFKIYYPADHDLSDIPVILWSHGFGGNRDGAAFLSRFVAAYGYIVVHLTHGGTDSSLWEGKPGHPWDVLRKTSVSRETTLRRFHDIPFVLDQLPIWAAQNPDIGKFLDLSAIGMSGHSFGALTTQVMAGQLFPDEEEKLTSYREGRLKAGILYSPAPIRHLVGEEPEKHIYGPISIPLLHMTGTDDDSPMENFDYKRRLTVHDYSEHPEKHLLVLEGGDHMVFNGTRGKLKASAKRTKHEEIIKIATLVFWDAHLKNDPAAREWLAGSGFKNYLAQDAAYSYTKI